MEANLTRAAPSRAEFPCPSPRVTQARKRTRLTVSSRLYFGRQVPLEDSYRLRCFSGSGTVGAIAAEFGAYYIGYDTNENFNRIAAKRLHALVIST